MKMTDSFVILIDRNGNIVLFQKFLYSFGHSSLIEFSAFCQIKHRDPVMFIDAGQEKLLAGSYLELFQPGVQITVIVSLDHRHILYKIHRHTLQKLDIQLSGIILPPDS